MQGSGSGLTADQARPEAAFRATEQRSQAPKLTHVAGSGVGTTSVPLNMPRPRNVLPASLKKRIWASWLLVRPEEAKCN
ncbi:MAG: hypothetical protein HC814_06130 [Rhodobacteraceae bacterium]|nr:hypothetical protein [Paracoccaceae bacterium]